MTENISDRIKEKIQETGIKQAHLAKKLGISPQHLSKVLERNSKKGKYIPKMAKMLGINFDSSEEGKTDSIAVLSEKELISLMNNTVQFDIVDKMAIEYWPHLPYYSYYRFGYQIKESVNSELRTNDLIIFSTCIPLNLKNKIGIALLMEKSLIFIGRVKYNQGKITIYNDNDCFLFSSNDVLLGVAVSLERNIENITT